MKGQSVEDMFDDACQDAVHRASEQGWDAYRCEQCTERRGAEVAGTYNGFVREYDYCEFDGRSGKMNKSKKNK